MLSAIKAASSSNIFVESIPETIDDVILKPESLKKKESYYNISIKEMYKYINQDVVYDNPS